MNHTLEWTYIKRPSKNSKDVYQNHPFWFNEIQVKSYYFFTDASKYCWEAKLCHFPSKSGSLDNLKLITFISGRLSHTYCNYTTLVRDTFAIHISFKRHSFYLQDAECTILCNNNPLKKSWKPKEKKINNWSTKLSLYNLNIQYTK